MRYGPATCPWCQTIVLDTSREHLNLRVTAFLDHARTCPERPTERVKQEPVSYAAGIVRLLRERQPCHWKLLHVGMGSGGQTTLTFGQGGE